MGTLPGACYAQGITSFLYQKNIRIFDYPKFAEPLRKRIRDRAHEVRAEAGIQIEHVSRSDIRKEEWVARVLAARGDAPGLVHVISATEACPSDRPWQDKPSGKTYLKPTQGKCLPALLFLRDRRRTRAVLRTRSDVGTVRLAVLLQWA